MLIKKNIHKKTLENLTIKISLYFFFLLGSRDCFSPVKTFISLVVLEAITLYTLANKLTSFSQHLVLLISFLD